MIMDTLDYPFDAPPTTGGLQKVAEGVYWLRLPLPFRLDHVNVWLLEDDTGWCLVDTGLADRTTRDLWQALLDGPVGERPIARILATHFHPDHLGLADWLQERTGAPLWITANEWLLGRMLSLDSTDALVETYRDFYRKADLPQALFDRLSNLGNAYRRIVPSVPAAFRRLHADDRLMIGGRSWRVIIGRGHAPEMACLYCDSLNLLIAADQVLPRISPNVAVWPNEPLADPLAEFLGSLKGFDGLDRSVLVLPSHGLPFWGLHERIADLKAHHAERLDAVLSVCETSVTGARIGEALFPQDLDPQQLAFASGETFAHINHLEHMGRLVRETGSDGIWRFKRP